MLYYIVMLEATNSVLAIRLGGVVGQSVVGEQLHTKHCSLHTMYCTLRTAY